MALKILIFFMVIGVFQSIHGKVYTRCGLTKQLTRLKFPRSFIGKWVCLIESESGKNTSRITNRAHGQGVGLFQIRSRNWCTFGKIGGSCKVKCEDMLDEYIDDDSICALKIWNELGFLAWNGWKRNCKGRNLPIHRCRGRVS